MLITVGTQKGLNGWSQMYETKWLEKRDMKALLLLYD